MALQTKGARCYATGCSVLRHCGQSVWRVSKQVVCPGVAASAVLRPPHHHDRRRIVAIIVLDWFDYYERVHLLAHTASQCALCVAVIVGSSSKVNQWSHTHGRFEFTCFACDHFYCLSLLYWPRTVDWKMQTSIGANTCAQHTLSRTHSACCSSGHASVISHLPRLPVERHEQISTLNPAVLCHSHLLVAAAAVKLFARYGTCFIAICSVRTTTAQN